MVNLTGTNGVEKKQANQPSERTRLTENLVATLWSSVDSRGEPRFYWDMDRFNPKNPDRPFATKRVSDLEETVEFVSVLASAFANSSSISPSLRDRLGRLGTGLAEFIASMKQPAGGVESPANSLFGGVM